MGGELSGQDETLVRFVHISDTHYNPDPTYNRTYAPHTPERGLEALVTALNTLPFAPDFVLHTGDLIYDPHPDAYNHLMPYLEKLDARLICIPGNHDELQAFQKLVWHRDEHELQPFSFAETSCNGVQILLADSNASPDVPAGRVDDSVMTQLEAACRAESNTPMIVAVHHNMLPVGAPWLDDWMRAENGLAFHECVRQAAHRLRGVFFGHIHQNMQVMRDGVLYVSAASPWSQFNSYPDDSSSEIEPDYDARPGFNIVTLSARQTTIRQHYFRVDIQSAFDASEEAPDAAAIHDTDRSKSDSL